MSLYSLWLEAHKKGILAPEWAQAHNFLIWATANKYRPEYGYKGKFTPDNLRAAILKAPNADVKATIADAFGVPEKALDQVADLNPDFYAVPNSKDEAGAAFKEASQAAEADIGNAEEKPATPEKEAEAGDNEELTEEATQPITEEPVGEAKTEIRGHFDANDLYIRLKLPELTKLAADMGIDTGDITTKRPIAKKIAAVEVVLFVNETGEWTDVPEWIKANPALMGVQLRREEG
jgi:hypothetical protein